MWEGGESNWIAIIKSSNYLQKVVCLHFPTVNRNQSVQEELKLHLFWEEIIRWDAGGDGCLWVRGSGDHFVTPKLCKED